jgi:diacylglycerol kinase (ATP)
MKYLFILNPISGPINRPFYIINAVDTIFRSSGHGYEFALTTAPGDATRLAAEAVENGFDYVVAAGGDGTVNEVGRALINTETILGVIPLGSGNGIARSMKIPLKMTNSLQLLVNPTFKHIDVCQVNNFYFIGVCGLGFDAKISEKFQNFGARGPVPYFIIGMRELITFKPQHLEIHLNGRKLSVSALVVAIANTQQYGNWAIIAPLADPHDGLFDLCILDNINFPTALRLSYKLFNGTIHKSRKYQHFRTDELKIECDGIKNVIHTDGEPVWCETPLHIRMLKGALKICAPAD